MKNSLPRRTEAEVRIENEEIKNRLTNVYGMQEYTSSLSPQLENAWLKSIEAYEKSVREERKAELRSTLSLN